MLLHLPEGLRRVSEGSGQLRGTKSLPGACGCPAARCGEVWKRPGVGGCSQPQIACVQNVPVPSPLRCYGVGMLCVVTWKGSC